MSGFSSPSARILADSISVRGDRLTTALVRVPQIIWQEWLTHRSLSRNSGSNRAVPIMTRIRQVIEDPFVPDVFPQPGKGMQPDGYTTPGTEAHRLALDAWLEDRDAAVRSALRYIRIGVGKEIANRILHSFLMNDAIVSATDWGNFFELRLAPDAQRQMRLSAVALHDAITASEPVLLQDRQWHLPLTGFPGDEDLDIDQLIRVSTGRSARTSYLTHDGRRDVQADLELYDRILGPRHLSPFEYASHPAAGRHGNYTGWKQARWYVERGLPFPAAGA